MSKVKRAVAVEIRMAKRKGARGAQNVGGKGFWGTQDICGRRDILARGGKFGGALACLLGKPSACSRPRINGYWPFMSRVHRLFEHQAPSFYFYFI